VYCNTEGCPGIVGLPDFYMQITRNSVKGRTAVFTFLKGDGVTT